MHTCPCCGDPLRPDQPWQLRNERAAGRPARQGDYVHRWCDDRLVLDAEERGDTA